MNRNEKIILLSALGVTLLSALLHYTNTNVVLVFIVVSIALALLAMVVGDATEQLGTRMGPAATGILQSGLGNLPELFVCIFALRAGLSTVVQAALIGSILGNSLLVFGVALLWGGLKNGRQTFKSEPPKLITILMLLAFAALSIPTFSVYFNTPAAAHINSLDTWTAIVLLIIFISSIFFSVKADKQSTIKTPVEAHLGGWSLPLTLIILLLSGIGAAFVSDWFVIALQPAMKILGINDIFAGLVVVALAGNAIENVVGVQLAVKNKADYSVSVILNSSLQVAIGLFPVLVLASFFLGGAILSFVVSPMLILALALAVLVSAFIVFDGESVWMEGLALICLYAIIAASFWWG